MKPGVVLCPVDFSSTSLEALHEAVAIVRATGERLLLLHVQELPLAPAEYPIMPAVLLEDATVALEAELEKWRADALAAGAREVETRLVTGVPWDRIVALARDRGARLIVLGTQGRTGIRHVLIGSVAEKVARHAPCSVLVTRAAEPHANCRVNPKV